MQAKDIDTVTVLRVIQDASDKTYRQGGGCRWAFTTDIEQAMPDVPQKVLAAKFKALIRRNLVTGCACGCRGDFELTAVGRALVALRAPS